MTRNSAIANNHTLFRFYASYLVQLFAWIISISVTWCMMRRELATSVPISKSLWCNTKYFRELIYGIVFLQGFHLPSNTIISHHFSKIKHKFIIFYNIILPVIQPHIHSNCIPLLYICWLYKSNTNIIIVQYLMSMENECWIEEKYLREILEI